ncbi:transglutaminase domain-containing protein [Flavobacterium sp. XS2P12]|uniref:transglutaminase domain-containing protein n=1 Tax=Flavobacterium melibiosi TaxID=3398734 RepID=UPI003A8705A2
MSFIDTLLYRTLQDGAAYQGLIPVYKGTQYNFDKEADNSNTYDTLRFMSEWALKFSHQMKAIAPLLKGNTKQETVNKIYNFLYSHFQYKLDGETQNLMSPSAAWHFRKTGFDCKTYSILASTILQNLGIPHSFRMVQQAGIMPSEWSHVYVIVPNGNMHFTIDATTHDNKEVSFTQKHDYTMKHKGLASPYVSALGCACQGTPIKSSGLGSPANLAITIRNFHSFLDVLEKQGFSKEVTNRMLTIVRANVENGIDPNMGEVLKKALATAGQLGEIVPSFSLTPAGSTYGGYATSLPTGNYVAPTSSSFSQFTSSAATAGMSALSNISVQGINVGSIATSLATGNFIGAGLDVLKAIIPMEKTFGAVFANGFDLSCWGASYSEQKAKLDIEQDLPFMVKWSGIYQQPTSSNLDRFMLVTQGYLDDAINGQQSKYASCTRKGHALRQKAIEQLRKDTFEQFTTQGFQLIPNGKKKSGISIPGGLPMYKKGQTWTGFNESTYDSFIVVPPKPVVQTPPPATVAAANTTGTTTNSTSTSGATTNSTGTPVTAKKSSSTPLILGAGLLALKLLL